MTVSNSKKQLLTPVRIFFGTILLVVLGATLYDVANRKSTNVVEVKENRAIGLDEMDLNELRIKFDSIQFANTALRPSTMIALDERIAVAKMMISKSGTPEELLAGKTHLMNALESAYLLRRENGLETASARDELAEAIAQVADASSGPDRGVALLLGYEIETQRIMDGSQTPETLEKTRIACETIGKEFGDVETAAKIENFLNLLLLAPDLGQEVDEIIRQVISVYSNSPEKKLQEWAVKLADDLVFRSLDMFEIYKGLGVASPDTAKLLLGKLDEVFRHPFSPLGFARIIGFCRDLDSQAEFEITLEAYRRIEQHLSSPELIDQNRENITECQYGIRRIESLGKPLTGKFVDVMGRSIELDGDGLKGNAMLVLAVRSAAEMEPAIRNLVSVSKLASRKIRFAVLCVGMDPEAVRKEFAKWLNDDFFIVPDPELNSLLFSFCPTGITPTLWVLSRDHTLIDFQVTPDQVPGIVDALSFAR